MEKNIECKITRKLAVLSSKQNGWQLELNEVSWNGGRPKLEVRRWNADHTQCNKGVTLSRNEAENLLAALKEELEE